MSKMVELGPVEASWSDGGSLWPLVVEAVLRATPDGIGLSEDYTVALRMAAIASDPLWRQTMAALSVGPREFARFESERIKMLMDRSALLESAVMALTSYVGGPVQLTINSTHKISEMLPNISVRCVVIGSHGFYHETKLKH